MRVATKKSLPTRTRRALRGSATLASVVGQVLARERIARGLSQQKLASRARLNQSAISRLEQGQVATIDQIWILAKSVGMASHELMQKVEHAVATLEGNGIEIVAGQAAGRTVHRVAGTALGALLDLFLEQNDKAD
jgi:transcriptional regulator with XRE-family HTH domain